MEELEGVPCKVLGYHITTRTQICLSCCVTSILELCVYLVVTAADTAVVVQHFRDTNRTYAILTLTFMLLPAIGCFCSIIVSPWQWPDENDYDIEKNKCGKQHVIFFLKQLYNLLLFPIGATYR